MTRTWHARAKQSGYRFSIRRFAARAFQLFWTNPRSPLREKHVFTTAGKAKEFAEELLAAWEHHGNPANRPFSS